jgi:N4-gp56 family major capsid protein
MTTGTATLSAELRTFYDRNLLERLLPRLVWALFGQPKPMPAHEGQTVNFRRFGSLAVATTALTEGTTPTGSELSVSQITVTPAQYGDFIRISDILDFTAPDPILTEGGDILAEQVAETIDILVRDVVVAGTTLQYAAGRVSRVTVAAGDKLNSSEVQKAVRTMHINKVSPVTQIMNASTGVGTLPVAGGYVGITGPQGLYDLKQDAKFIQVHQYGAGQGSLLPNEVGSLDEVRFIMSNASTVYAGAGAAGIDVYATVIIGANAFGVVQPMGVQTIIKDFGVGGDDPLNQRATSGWKMYMKAVILQQLAILRIEHAVS